MRSEHQFACEARRAVRAIEGTSDRRDGRLEQRQPRDKTGRTEETARHTGECRQGEHEDREEQDGVAEHPMGGEGVLLRGRVEGTHRGEEELDDDGDGEQAGENVEGLEHDGLLYGWDRWVPSDLR
ncbi:hypothetical protein IDVR_37850 [Intrasporangium sp. DVR]